ETVQLDVARAATDVDWENNIVVRCDVDLRSVLLSMNLAKEELDKKLRIDTRGRAFLGKLLLGLDERLSGQLVAGVPINGRYVLERLLASGKNSITYKADDRRLGRVVVLKFFRPGRGEGIIGNVARLGRVNAQPILVNVLDVFQYEIADLHGR